MGKFCFNKTVRFIYLLTLCTDECGTVPHISFFRLLPSNAAAHGLLHAFHGLFNIQASVRNVFHRTRSGREDEKTSGGAHQTSTDRKALSL